jgi:hypothetical protein
LLAVAVAHHQGLQLLTLVAVAVALVDIELLLELLVEEVRQSQLFL